MRNPFGLVWSASAAFGCLLTVATWAQAAAPAIAGFDRFHADKPDADGGRLLIGELNCVACHKADAETLARLQVNPAPPLNDVGLRLKPQWVRQFIADPHKMKPGTRMPGPPHSIPEALVAEHAEALVHYLMSQQAGKLSNIKGKASDGVGVFNAVGCAACHAPLGKETAVSGDKATVPLPDLKAKYASGAALASFLLDPHKWRPGGRMPKLGLTGDEAVSIAAAFGLSTGGTVARIGIRPSDDVALKEAGLTGAELSQGVSFEIYKGSWNKLPAFAAMKPSDSGSIKKFDVSKMNGEDNFAFRFRGYVEAPRDGVYTFHVHSDDGSRLTIGRDVVVESDRVQGGTETSGAIELKKGRHAITVEYFEAQGGEELRVSMEGPQLGKKEISGAMLAHSKSGKFVIGQETKPAPSPDVFVPEPEQIAKGRSLFSAIGCVACHGSPETGNKTTPANAPLLEPKPLAQLKAGKGKGCLSEKPVGFAQNFSLSKPQIEAIAAALATLDTPLALSTEQSIDRTMTALNCYACHARGDKGGPEEGHKAFFTGTYADLADEGRLPPHLSDVGAKLTKPWLTQILTQGTKVRPYMNTRMPVFGSMVTHLVADFEKAHPAVEVKAPTVSQKDAMTHGRALVGTGGMACVQCHVFAGEKSLGLPAMDLALMPQRLKREWFGRYLLDPAKLRPGTRMPQFWPQGVSVRQDILEGDTDLQIENIWQYLSRGMKAPLPPGLARAGMLLTAETEAVMYRNFIQGAGTRAIGVGYPQKVNLAWDANTLRPAMIWQGDFIDASKHWIDRGSGFQGPAGYSVINLPEGPPIGNLAAADAAWPALDRKNNVIRAAGFDFKGYSLDKLRRPTFMYTTNGMKVSEFYEGVAAGSDDANATLKRTLTIETSQAVENYFARIATGKIEPAAGGAFKVNDDLVIKITGDAKAVVRTVGGKQELIVPIKMNGGKAVIATEYIW